MTKHEWVETIFAGVFFIFVIVGAVLALVAFNPPS